MLSTNWIELPDQILLYHVESTEAGIDHCNPKLVIARLFPALSSIVILNTLPNIFGLTNIHATTVGILGIPKNRVDSRSVPELKRVLDSIGSLSVVDGIRTKHDHRRLACILSCHMPILFRSCALSQAL